jgi:pyrophosphatase PpaX
MDGTLVDTIGLILRAFHETFTALGVPDREDPELLALIGKPLWAQMRIFDPSRVDELCATYQSNYEKFHDELARAFPGVEETLAELERRGHVLGVVTSKRRVTAQPGLAYFGLDGYFQAIVTANDTERHKPEPDPVLKALEMLGCQPGSAAYVGDSVYDIECGNAAGVLSVAALWGPFPRDLLATRRPGAFAEKPEDLLGLFP